MSHRSSSSVADLGHAWLAHAESLGQIGEFPTFRSQCSHVCHVGITELRSRIGLASMRAAAGRHVGLVLGHRPGSKVRGIAAGRVVTEMHDDGPPVELGVMSNLIRSSRGNRCPAVSIRDYSVAMLVAGSGPRPADVGAPRTIGVMRQSFFSGCSIKPTPSLFKCASTSPSLIVQAAQSQPRSTVCAILDDAFDIHPG